jgi:hypothetical protein
MQKNQGRVGLNEPENDEIYHKLRPRRLAHRIRMLSGTISAQATFAKVDEKLNSPISVDMVLMDCRGRTRINARCLMFPGMIFNGYDDDLSVVCASKRGAIQGIRDKFSTEAALALAKLVDRGDLPPLPEVDTIRYWGKNVAAVLLDNL